MRVVSALSLCLLLFGVMPTAAVKTFCEQQLMQEHGLQNESEDNDDTGLDDVSALASQLAAGDDLYYEPNGGWYPGCETPLRTCYIPSSNARGHYTSHLAPCTFMFHSVVGDTSTDGFDMTTACFTDANHVVGESHTMVDYVNQWPDECVGDFARCYSIKEDQHVYLRTACKRKWNVPNGTTHFSVNCTADKAVKVKMTQEQLDKKGVVDPYMKQQLDHETKMLHEEEIAVMVTGIAVFLLGVVCCFMAHRWFVVPYHNAQSMSIHQEEVMDLVPETGRESGHGRDNESYPDRAIV